MLTHKLKHHFLVPFFKIRQVIHEANLVFTFIIVSMKDQFAKGSLQVMDGNIIID